MKQLSIEKILVELVHFFRAYALVICAVDSRELFLDPPQHLLKIENIKDDDIKKNNCLITISET